MSSVVGHPVEPHLELDEGGEDGVRVGEVVHYCTQETGSLTCFIGTGNGDDDGDGDLVVVPLPKNFMSPPSIMSQKHRGM